MSQNNNAQGETSGSKNEAPVTIFGDGDSSVAIVEFQGQLREQLVESLNRNLVLTGKYASDAKAISPQTMESALVAGTGAGLSALSAMVAPTLYVATANPATLMHFGGGLGSAVMGSGGIVAQAPFIPVAATLPAVLPVLAMQTLTTAVILKQFSRLDKKIDLVKKKVEEVIARTEATHVGELISAAKIVDEVYRQYEISGEFSRDMLIRAALAEHDVNRLYERYRLLVEGRDDGNFRDENDIQQANFDVHSAMLSSFLRLRLGFLRMCIDMQENPRTVKESVENIKQTLRSDRDFWEMMLSRSEKIRESMTELEKKLGDMHVVEKIMPGFNGDHAEKEKKLKLLKDAYVSTLQSEKNLAQGFTSLIDSAKKTLQVLDRPELESKNAPKLLYWKDETGAHSITTNELDIS
ncbi:MAG: hypothetical protein MSC45_08330 [Mobiluncus sp.]|uniref:hypothetical protein n=1 Tax=Mobiluncus sp. TaxID=47293 RepID=UPI00258AF4C6|nr:hypothetical protein [Mobiluncus sp.]MCI6585055.1 hypothetical protein [Mobiluncus sp.]